jgi:hypothetical protein
MIDHVTYELNEQTLHSVDVTRFLYALGMVEVRPDAAIEAEYDVRWFKYQYQDFYVHLVARVDFVIRAKLWDHFCAIVQPDRYGELAKSKWLERDSGSGRIWLSGPGGIRVEVRSF